MRFLMFLVLTFGAVAPAVAQRGDETPRAYDSLNQRDKEREMQAQHWEGPSGMWTSPHKAKGGAYRYRLMGIGAVLLVGMGIFMMRLIKRANAERAARG